MDRYLEIFVQEAMDHIGSLGNEIISIECEASIESVESAFRHAHIIKSMAEALGFSNIADLARHLEYFFSANKDSPSLITKSQIEAALSAADAISSLVESVSGNKKPDANKDISKIKDSLMQGDSRKSDISGPESKTGMQGKEIDPFISVASTSNISRLKSLYFPRSNPFGFKAGGGGSRKTVRIHTEHLDGIIDESAELIIAANRLKEMASEEEHSSYSFFEVSERILHYAKSIQLKALTARMVPLSTITGRLSRAARETRKILNKEVLLHIEGEDIELDRNILEAIEIPLNHIIRNSIDHGIETPQIRKSLGKPSRGRIDFLAVRDRDRVIIEITDDGKGIDADALLMEAEKLGFPVTESFSDLSGQKICMLACLPGLSTSSEISEISGRGEGLDIVRETVNSLGGQLEIASEKGRGCSIILSLPLTVAIQSLLIIGIGREIFAVPTSNVLNVVEISPAKENLDFGHHHIEFRGINLNAWSLSRLLEIPSSSPLSSLPCLVMENDIREKTAFSVDRLHGEIKSIVKPPSSPLHCIPGITGISTMPDGRPLLILNPLSLLPSAEGSLSCSGMKAKDNNCLTEDEFYTHADPEKFTDNHWGFLKEITNIGSGGSTSILSQLIGNRPVMMDNISASVKTLNDLFFSSEDRPDSGTVLYSCFYGDIRGYLFLCFHNNEGKRFADIISGAKSKEIFSSANLDHLINAKLKLTDSFLKKAGKFAGLELLFTSPFFYHGSFSTFSESLGNEPVEKKTSPDHDGRISILSDDLIRIGKNRSLKHPCIETRLHFMIAPPLTGHLSMVPFPESLTTLFEKIAL